MLNYWVHWGDQQQFKCLMSTFDLTPFLILTCFKNQTSILIMTARLLILTFGRNFESSCHDESWYGPLCWHSPLLLLLCLLPLWNRSRWTSVSAKPPHKGVFNVSTLSTREGIDGSSNAQEEMVFRQVWEKSEFVTRWPSKLAKQPNNHKTVAHIINPGKITRFVHATDLAWQIENVF